MVKPHRQACGYVNGTLLRREVVTRAGDKPQSSLYLLSRFKHVTGCPTGSQGVRGVREGKGAGQEGSGLQPLSLPVQSPHRLHLH
jgi:hypothetical protein